MAQWRVREPGSFSPAMHAAMRAGPGVKIVTRSYTLPAIRRMQVEWQLFRLSLRNYPTHPSAPFESMHKHRTKVRWSKEMKMWELVLTTREGLEQEVESIREVL